MVEHCKKRKSGCKLELESNADVHMPSSVSTKDSVRRGTGTNVDVSLLSDGAQSKKSFSHEETSCFRELSLPPICWSDARRRQRSEMISVSGALRGHLAQRRLCDSSNILVILKKRTSS